MLDCGVLKFGSFKAKSGRQTPYFLDSGRYGRGAQLARLGAFYADRLLASLGDGFDVLFGPAYKGIPLVVSTAMALAERGRELVDTDLVLRSFAGGVSGGTAASMIEVLRTSSTDPAARAAMTWIEEHGDLFTID